MVGDSGGLGMQGTLVAAPVQPSALRASLLASLLDASSYRELVAE